jgi:hypothetical protein
MRWETQNIMLLCAKHHNMGKDAWHEAGQGHKQEWFRNVYGDIFYDLLRSIELQKIEQAKAGVRLDKAALKEELEAELATMEGTSPCPRGLPSSPSSRAS